MRAAHCLALLEPGGRLAPYSFERGDLRPADLAVQAGHCGVCHSDLSAIGPATSEQLPLVPGYEFVGIVTAAGPDVMRYRFVLDMAQLPSQPRAAR